jgi:hypothetical protein
MRYIFHNHADIDYIKHRLDGDGNDPAITPELGDRGWFQYAYMDDSENESDFEWDRDRGIKNNPGCVWNYLHIRLYAVGSGDRNYNTNYGYYVVASSHRDHEGGGNCQDRYTSYEEDEDWLIDRIEDHLGPSSDYNWTVQDPGLYWSNAVTGAPDIGEGVHHYESNGRGVNINVPGKSGED